MQAMKFWWKRRFKLFPALLFAALPLAFLAGIALYQLTEAVPKEARVRAETIAGFETLVAIRALDEAVQDAERGQRGYLLTGRESYLEPYRRAKAALPRLIMNLQQAFRDNPEEQQRLLLLQAGVTSRMNELESAIETYNTKGFEAVRAMVETDAGKNSMHEILADIAALLGAEKARLASRMEQGSASIQRVTAVFVTGSLISALALIAGASLLGNAYGRATVSEQTLQATLDSVREGVGAFDDNGNLRAWNTPFANILDVPAWEIKRAQPIPIGAGSIVTGNLGSLIRDLQQAAMKARGPILVNHVTPGGRILEIFCMRLDGGYVCTLLDVTDQRHAEEALRQSQRLESLGQMTGGVAHDFNNLLTIMIGGLSFLRRTANQDPKLSERLDMLEIAVERGARLTKQLLAFARRQPLQPEVINLGQLMQEIMPLLRRAAGEEIAVESVVGAGLWNTTIDTAQFQSAVLNLVINSRHAMPDGGKLTIEVANAVLDEHYAASHAEVEPGQYILFAVTDTGCGMDSATMSKAMDPFFTTKPKGEGTGLGLAQVYGFVKQSGGHIKIYSERGEGTTVKLYLPRSHQESVPQHSRPATAARTGSETILLVDDDEIVRATVSSMLEDLGYGVLTAESGAQALAMMENGAAPDLLFTDVVMPVMGGRQLAERALQIRPSLRVLFTSGYTENAIVHNGRLDTGVELLSKPYDRERLAAKLRRVLDKAKPAAGPGKEGDQQTG